MNLLLSKSAGCLAGLFCGDAYGAQYEFMAVDEVANRMDENGADTMGSSVVFQTPPGHLTDDSEMALALLRSIAEAGEYRQDAAREHYVAWMNSYPIDIGRTTMNGLRGYLDYGSQANGALMRVAPLAVYLAATNANANGWVECDRFAREDAAITHPHEVCQQVNVLYVRMLVSLLLKDLPAPILYRNLRGWASALCCDETVLSVIEDAKSFPPENLLSKQGWVLIAFQNAIYRMLHAESPAECIIETCCEGGDTDTNAAIAGALVGARDGVESFPINWIETVNACGSDLRCTRPEEYRVHDIFALTRDFISLFSA